ncbi:DNA mismatch repair protein [Vibrio sp. S4M6]|uniref:DNA mismatch repair protein n=1 Tax=Vibrio sinus TaxID=2946865 RepID=UPI00202A225E|nr:DNA mismatch repair protein [Vibrio sinus]MCL9781686.1 DNA mismatch repair protein [Vibrio sinus]
MMVRLPQPWLLVLIGLILNVLAIVMSSIVLDKLSEDIEKLNESKQQNQYSIQLAWNSVETLERKREAVLLHIQAVYTEKVSQMLQEAVQNQLRHWVGQPVPDISHDNLGQIMRLINQAQQGLRDRIDDYYLENLSISERVLKLNEKIAWYKNIGLFLQVFGLALILARDLARKH